MGRILFARLRSHALHGASVSAPFYLNGGIPQGTKWGPVLFPVMVNDLVKSWGARIKFVDDLTVLQAVPRNSPSLLDVVLDDMRCIFTSRTIGMTSFSVGTNRTIGTNGPLELPCTQRDLIKNNLSPLNEMHIHQQNHCNDVLFYW